MMEPLLTLSEKRRLFKVLQTVGSLNDIENYCTTQLNMAQWLKDDFNVEISSRLGQLIFYCVLRCSSLSDALTCSLSTALHSLKALHESVSVAGAGMVICQWSSSELAQAAGRKAALLGTVQVMSKEDCVIARDHLPRTDEVRIARDSPGRLYRWIYLMRSFVSGQNELLTVPPGSEVNETEWTLNILQLSPETGYTCPGTGNICIHCM
jgi:hypothetical protein